MKNKLINISEALSIAFHLCVYLALPKNKNKNISSLKIATALGVSRDHLAKVLQRLDKARLVSSIRGRKGGFALNRSSEKIPLMEIYETIDGPFPKNYCLLHVKKCSGNCCLFGELLEQTHLLFENHFKDTTLDNLIEIYGKECENGRNEEHNRN